MDNNVAEFLIQLRDWASVWVPVGAGVWAINRHFKSQMQDIRVEWKQDFRDFRADTHAWLSDFRAEMRNIRLEMKDATDKHEKEWKEANERHEKEWKDLLGKFHLIDKTVALMEKNKD